MMIPLLYAFLALLPAVLLLGALEFHSRSQRAAMLRLPVTNKLLRSPGESAFKKIKEFDQKTLEIIIAFIVVPAVVLAFYLSFKLSALHPLPGVGGILLVVGIAVFIGALMHLIGILRQREHRRPGCRGERFVGEQLDKLISEGCRVFHDFPLDENWNLDHVVVAPSGVYAIETKAKRKKKFSPGQCQLSHEIIYDGKGLQFPDHYDTSHLAEAQNQADRLAQILGREHKEQVYVNPILTFPGWYVISKALGEVTVLNPKQIHLRIVNSTPILSQDQVRRIACLLEGKCRDVEF